MSAEKKKARKQDPEIRAIQRITAITNELSPYQASRVLRFVTERVADGRQFGNIDLPTGITTSGNRYEQEPLQSMEKAAYRG
jgi:hypothetical protein